MNTINTKIIDIINGELLGDGWLGYPTKNKQGVYIGNCRFQITLKNKEHIFFLWKHLSDICSDLGPMPRSDSDTKHIIDSYSFKSQVRVELTELHKKWYKLNTYTGKYEKFVPLNISELLTPIGLAHWLMGDGYWENQARTIKLCTDSFTKAEVDLLIDALDKLFNIKATSNIRTRNNKGGVYRIRIAIKSLPLLREIVIPYFTPSMLYKLGPVN